MVVESLGSVFVETVAPVLAIAGAGYALGTLRDVDVEPLNAVTLYVLLPALVFHSLTTGSLGGATAGRLVAGFVAFTLAMLAIAAAVGRAIGESGGTFGALVVASAFPNAGNFGIPVAEFAFGQVGRSAAVLFVVVQNVLLYTLGTYLVTRETAGERGGALRRIARFPLLYVVALALAVAALGLAPPADGAAMETIETVGNASIPLFLLILGLQLADTDGTAALRRASPALALKLGAAPLVGVAVAVALGIGGTAARAFVLLCAGPAAVSSLVLLVEFGGDEAAGPVSGPEYAGTVVFASLLAAVPLVTVLVYALQAGFVV